MPLFSISFLLFTLGNLGLPGTSSFPGELLVLIGAFQVNKITSIIASSGMVLGGAYSIWLYNRVVFGQYKAAYIDTSADLNRREFWILTPLILCMFIFGIFPDIILEGLNATAIKFTCL
jgi:NADH-quinone oxidoreductase subunit M